MYYLCWCISIHINNMYREMYAGELPIDELPAHVFVKSIRNITIERGWYRLWINFDNNVKSFFFQGEDQGIYNKMNPQH